MDLRSLNNRTDPQEIQSFNYTGILSSNFFLEAQYSERNYEIATGLGGVPDLIQLSGWSGLAWSIGARTLWIGRCVSGCVRVGSSFIARPRGGVRRPNPS